MLYLDDTEPAADMQSAQDENCIQILPVSTDCNSVESVYTLDDTFFTENTHVVSESVTIVNVNAGVSHAMRALPYVKKEKPVSVYRIVPIPKDNMDPIKLKSLTTEQLKASQVITISDDGEVVTSGDCSYLTESILDKITEKHLKKKLKKLLPQNVHNRTAVKKLVRLPKSHICQYCNRDFKAASHLKRHINGHFGIKAFKCDVCSKEFLDHSTLQRHRKIHLGEKPWTCKVCSKSFGTLGSLRRHMTVHNPEGRPYKCDTCDKRFPDRSSYRKHVFIHTGLKPHICDICGKRFVHIGDLNGHRKIHVSTKDFECNECGKQFVKQSNYARHMNIHRGKECFKCMVCGVAYNFQSSLTRHLLTHNKGGKKKRSLPSEVLRCDVCDDQFNNFKDLSDHIHCHFESEKREDEEDVDGVMEIITLEPVESSKKERAKIIEVTESKNKSALPDLTETSETENCKSTEATEVFVSNESETETKSKQFITFKVLKKKDSSQKHLTLEEIRFLRRKLNRCKRIAQSKDKREKFDCAKVTEMKSIRIARRSTRRSRGSDILGDDIE